MFNPFDKTDTTLINNLLGFGRPSYTFLEGEIYNPETHDLVPKQSYIEKQLKYKKEQLLKLKEQGESYIAVLNRQEELLRDEIAAIEKSLEKELPKLK